MPSLYLFVQTIILGNCVLADNTSKEIELMQGYCVKCRAKREIKNAETVTLKNGRQATRGVCPICGTKMFRLGKS